jgi:hypothetical protein
MSGVDRVSGETNDLSKICIPRIVLGKEAKSKI